MPENPKAERPDNIRNNGQGTENIKNLISFLVFGLMIIMALGFLLLTYIDYRKTLGSIDDSKGLYDSMYPSDMDADADAIANKIGMNAKDATEKPEAEQSAKVREDEKTKANETVNAEAKPETEQKPEQEKIMLKEYVKVFGSFDGYVTVGTSKDEVEKILGKPSLKQDNLYQYGNTTVIFDIENKVYGFAKDVKSDIKITIGNKVENPPELAVGMTMLEVRDALGTPNKLLGFTWYYGYQEIVFNDSFRVEKITDTQFKIPT